MDGGIPPVQWIRHLSLRECMSLKFHTARKIYARLRTEKEKTYYKSVRYVIGSTPWDKAYIINKYPQVRYFTCQYLFRKEFYQEDKWAFTKTESGSILTGQATSPVKGLHILIKALYYVKKEIKNVKLYIPGPNITAKEFIQNYSYAKYIKSLIHKYCLEDNVIFIGNLQETAMVERMRKSQIVVVPSAIELGSSMLCEAMLLGVPVIAAYRGGMTEKFQHGISGFYYDYKEVFLLAEYIKKLLTDQNLAEMFSANEKSLAHEVHDEEKCCRQFYLTYKKILQ
jgi:glycosyltransferase involved in cell wall biosynthesis